MAPRNWGQRFDTLLHHHSQNETKPNQKKISEKQRKKQTRDHKERERQLWAVVSAQWWPNHLPGTVNITAKRTLQRGFYLQMKLQGIQPWRVVQVSVEMPICNILTSLCSLGKIFGYFLCFPYCIFPIFINWRDSGITSLAKSFLKTYLLFFFLPFCVYRQDYLRSHLLRATTDLSNSFS